MTNSAQQAEPAADPDDLDFSVVAESDLIEWMAAAESCQKEAEAAFAEFHRRHAKYLYAQLQKRYPGFAEDIASETLLRAYKKAGKFDLKRLTNSGTPEQQRPKVRAWLGGIAHNLAADLYAAREKDPVTHSSTTSLPDDWGHDRASDEPVSNDELSDRVREVLDSLPEREREIALVMAHNWQSGEKANRWSREEIATVAARLGETPENIRQIKCRLHKKLEKRLAPLIGASVYNR